MGEKVKGGKNVYGLSIGILMLETRTPRIPGDIGNATTWDFPVVYRIVKGALPTRIVKEADPKLLKPFIEAAQDLEKLGVKAITTCCGFFAIFQKEMTEAVTIPVFTSSLIQVPLVYRMLKSNQKVGIITADSSSLSKKHLACVGADSIPTAIIGTEEEEFSKVFVGNEPALDVEGARNTLVNTARRLISKHPEVGAIVLECTNMPPYAKSIQEEVNLPVFDIYTLTNMVYSTLVRKDFTGLM
ncbi:aspartate/glutamate racemase family protein [Chloroflexota bacterium]